MASKLRSKFFRVAAEGDTIDGREITRKQIQDMASTYDPKVYGARVWSEHFRGLIPGGPFDALGDVVALKAEEIKDGTELDGKLGLYAQVDALPSLVTLNASGQKIYHSIEMATRFGKNEQAYCVGLAATDTPASKGTQVLAFGDGSGDVIVGKTHESKLEFAGGDATDDGEGKPAFFARVKDLLGKNKGETNQRFSDLEKAIEATATYAADLEKRLPGETVPKADFDALKQSHDALATQFAALSEKLNGTPAPGQQERDPATGGTGTTLADY